MKIKTYKSDIDIFNNVKGLFLLYRTRIIVLRDFKYVMEKTKPVKNFLGYTPKPKEIYYITQFILEGYHTEGDFIGTYDDEFCKTVIGTVNFYTLKNNWIKLNIQYLAFLKHNGEIEKQIKNNWIKLNTQYLAFLKHNDEIEKQIKNLMDKGVKI